MDQIIQFSTDNPAKKEPIKSLGPDCLNQQMFHKKEFKKRLLIYSKDKQILIADALLDQKIIAGIGNKYKSEILFICKINPFKQITQLTAIQQNILFTKIPKLLKYGYENSGRTRPLLNNEKYSWNISHWYFVGQEESAGSADQRFYRKES